VVQRNGQPTPAVDFGFEMRVLPTEVSALAELHYPERKSKGDERSDFVDRLICMCWEYSESEKISDLRWCIGKVQKRNKTQIGTDNEFTVRWDKEACFDTGLQEGDYGFLQDSPSWFLFKKDVVELLPGDATIPTPTGETLKFIYAQDYWGFCLYIASTWILVNSYQCV
jgi:hypothetical protein